MGERYRHTQIGYVMLGGLGGGIALVAVVMAATGFNWIALAVLVVLAAIQQAMAEPPASYPRPSGQGSPNGRRSSARLSGGYRRATG